METTVQGEELRNHSIKERDLISQLKKKFMIGIGPPNCDIGLDIEMLLNLNESSVPIVICCTVVLERLPSRIWLYRIVIFTLLYLTVQHIT